MKLNSLLSACMALPLTGFGWAFGQIHGHSSPTPIQSNNPPIQLFEPQSKTKPTHFTNEDVSKRTANSKHFRNGDGTFTAVLHTGPVHFEKNGQFIDINNQLIAENNAYVNKNNLMQTTFGKTTDQAVISTTTEGSVTEFVNPSLYWEINGQKIQQQFATSTMAMAQNNTLTYPNLFGEISAQYTLSNGKKRLDYIIPNPAALGNVPAHADYLVFTEDIILPQGWTHTTTAKGIHIQDTQGKVIYLYENPTSNDAKDFGLFNHNTKMEATKVGNTLTLKTKVESSWLLSSARVYPLTIDPSTTVYPMDEENWTVQVNSIGQGQSGLPAAGGTSNGIWYRGFITFDLSSLPAANILDAQIKLTTVNKQGNFSDDYPIGLTQSNYDLPVWAETFEEVYDYITHPANMAGDYVAISNPGAIGSTQTYNLGNAARADIAKKTGSVNSFFALSLRQGWEGGAPANRYVVYADHSQGSAAPALVLNYEQNDNYCHPMHLYSNCAALGDCAYIGIGKVELGTLNSTTTYDNYPIGYNKFNGNISLTTKNNYTLKITYKDNATNANKGKVAAWIDWNGDGNFSTNEFIGASAPLTNGQVQTYSITVPDSAVSGVSRLRVRSIYEDETIGASDACSTMEYGETEDYVLTLINDLGLNELNANPVSIYPNPATDLIHIQSTSAIVAVEIFNLSGQKVLQGKTNRLAINTLPQGTYVVQVKTQDGKTTTQKLIKK